MSPPDELWWRVRRGGGVHTQIWNTVRRIEMQQSDVFERLHRLEILYDPNTPMLADMDDIDHRRGGVHENIIASNVDTVAAMIATSDIRARVDTDGADWEQQRTARRLEFYIEEIVKRYGVLVQCRGAFKECAKKGNGIVKVEVILGELRIQQVMVENLVVDQHEARDNREPMQIHEWVACDADELIARFPKQEREIERARTQRVNWRIDNRYMPIFDNQVVYLDSYRRPIGIKGEKGYRPGRHAITLQSATLLDDPWDKGFPYADMFWTKRAKSWYAIGGAERIAGIQNALNRRNWHIEKQLERAAVPTTYIRPADANLQVKTSRIGAVAVVRGDYPHTVVPTAVSGETYQSRVDLKNAGSEEFGLSRMATHAAKPPGLDSAVALREFKDQTTDRYAPQENGFERLVLDTILLAVGGCKELGEKAPTMVRQGRFGRRTMAWKDVDLGDLKVQLYAASTTPRTPAGRMQFVIELAQAGVISTDSSTRLLEHPDIESEISLYTAAIDSVEECLDEIAEGKVVMPEPFMNAAMCRWRGQREYLKWLTDGAPDEVLELLRQFVVQAAWLEERAGGGDPQQGLGEQPGALPPGAAPPGMPPQGMPPGGIPQGMPTNGPPQSAFAPSAMSLVPGTG